MSLSRAQVRPGSAASLHKVQVSDPALAEQLAAKGVRRIGDYGQFQVFEVDSATATALAGKTENRDDYNLIKLNSGRLNTSLPQMQAARQQVGAFAGKRMHLVHFAGPVQPGWRQSLLNAGVQIVSYIPQNAYLVYGDTAAIARVQALAAGAPHIQWEGAYQDAYKIHPAAKPTDAQGNPRRVATEWFAVQLMEDPPNNAQTVQLMDRLKLEPFRRQYAALHYMNVVGRFNAADLAQIAAQPDVVSIQPYYTPTKLDERQDQIIAGNLNGNAPEGPGYLSWLASKGFTQAQFNASGIVVDISDSGIDDGTTTPNHFGLYVNGQTSAGSRVVYNRLEGMPNAGSSLGGWDGHGNINSHIVGGFDNSSGFPFADSAGYHYGLGVCPFVRLGSSVIFDPDNFTSPNYSTLASDAYRAGARISNNSWGDSGSQGAYNSDAQAYDALVRDADASTAGNQEMVFVFAAGNDGNNGAGTINAPGSAKNVITVGAAQNVQSLGGTDGCGWDDTFSANANEVFSYSSRGPCADGRHKPDIMAPGSRIIGGVPQARNPGLDGTADPRFLADAGGICGGVGTNNGVNLFFPDGQQFYTTSTGTSHSTPAVAGGCALVRQYFINQGWNTPSAAMTKAYLLNSARYMTGRYANDTLYSDTQGMGEMDLGAAFDGASRILRDQLSGELFTATGQTRTYSGVVADSSKPFRVTLAWTDAPGSTTASSAANNDLDLTVTIGGVTYKGNVFSGAYSVSGGVADMLDNVESVYLPPGTSGPFTITVTAANINSAGVPNVTDSPEQDFALVAYNAHGIEISGATLAAESCTPTNGAIDPGETVTVNFSLVNIGPVNTTNLTATMLTSGGVTSPSGPVTYGALSAGGAAVTMPFTFTAAGTCGGTITASLALADGTTGLGTITWTFQLGQFTQTTDLSENFDGVTAPALPTGWTTDATNGQGPWRSVTSSVDTRLNAAFCAASTHIGVGELYSPVISINSAAAKVVFRNNYSLETDGVTAYDGGVLEIKIASGGWQDILAAGGSFISGGYNYVISSNEGAANNPLAGRQAWSGSSGPYATNSYITTVAQLPASAAGQTIQLRWRCGTDSGNELGSVGWWIDTINVFDGIYACCNGGPLTQPQILSPANGYATTTPSIEVSGVAVAGLPLTLFDNGTGVNSVLVGGNGLFSFNTELFYGTNVLVAAEMEDGTNLPGAAVTVVLTPFPPTLSLPTNSAPTVNFVEQGVPYAVVNLSEAGVLLSTFTNNAAGSFAGSVPLANGPNFLSVTQTTNGVTSVASSPVGVNVITVTPPGIIAPAPGFVSSVPVIAVIGTGIPGAAVRIYEGTNVLTNTVVKPPGYFTNSIRLVPGTQDLTAIQYQTGVPSAASAPVAVSWVVPPPVFLTPASGLVTTNPSLAITGTALAGAKVTLYDNNASNSSVISTATGRFSASITLRDGVHPLTAVQTANGLASLPSAPAVNVTMRLIPFITLAPQSQSMFVSGHTAFAAGASGAAPLRFFWTHNGVLVSGAALQTLAFPSVVGGNAGTYRMVATNAYGSAMTDTVILTLIPNPFTNLNGTYYGLFSETPAQFRSSGMLKLTLTTLGSFSGSVLNAGGTYSFVGAFTPTGMSVTNVPRAGKTPLALSMTLDVSNGTQQISGSLTDSNWTAGLLANLEPYSTTSPAPQKGAYTLVLGSSDSGATGPGGAGFGKVTVTPAGLASLAGTLSDGTVVAPAAAGLSRNGLWPLYLPLYTAGTLGSLSGWVDFTNSPGSSLQGIGNWFRTNSSGKLYPHGFTNTVSITGSTFTPGTTRTNVLGQTNLQVQLSGGNLPVALSNNVTLFPTGSLKTNGPGVSRLTLSVVPSSGLISGTFLDPSTGLATPISGVVLQQQTNAAGFFLSTNASGLFQLIEQ